MGARAGACEHCHDGPPSVGEPANEAPSSSHDPPVARGSLPVVAHTPVPTSPVEDSAKASSPLGVRPEVGSGAASPALAPPPLVPATPALPPDVATVVAMGFPARLARLALRAVNPPATPSAAVTWLLNAPGRGSGGGGPIGSVKGGSDGPTGGAPPAELPALRSGLSQLVAAASAARPVGGGAPAAGRETAPAGAADADPPPSAADVALDTLHACCVLFLGCSLVFCGSPCNCSCPFLPLSTLAGVGVDHVCSGRACYGQGGQPSAGEGEQLLWRVSAPAGTALTVLCAGPVRPMGCRGRPCCR